MNSSEEINSRHSSASSTPGKRVTIHFMILDTQLSHVGDWISIGAIAVVPSDTDGVIPPYQLITSNDSQDYAKTLRILVD